MDIIIDGRVDNRLSNDFLTLNLWGQTLLFYCINTVLEAFPKNAITVITRSPYVNSLIEENYGKSDRIQICNEIDFSSFKEETLLVSGRAPFISVKSMVNAVSSYSGGILQSAIRSMSISHSPVDIMGIVENDVQYVNAFMIFGKTGKLQPYLVNDEEGVVVNTKNDFELALILQKKKINRKILTDSILSRIKEKQEQFRGDEKICLVGHSQLDNWNISELCGCKVRNCGIKGISSFEYNDYILDKEMLSCESDIFIVMHGTNDIVYDYSDEEIVSSIQKSLAYINNRNHNAKMFFVSILSVNGRLDRSNRRIETLNGFLQSYLTSTKIEWIDMANMNDEYGNLKKEYTSDGLHLSEVGYAKFGKIIENAIIKYC